MKTSVCESNLFETKALSDRFRPKNLMKFAIRKSRKNLKKREVLQNLIATRQLDAASLETAIHLGS